MNACLSVWGRLGGTRGRLGFPVTDAVNVEGPTRRPSGTRTAGWRQVFEGGTVYCTEKTGAVEVNPAVAEYHNRRGHMGGTLGFPVSPELDVESRYGGSGKLQRFEWLEDHSKEFPGGGAIYSSPAHDIYCVTGGIARLYGKLGGPGGFGFPTSDKADGRKSADEPPCWFQDFEGGTIFWKEKYRSVAVSAEMMSAFSRRPSLRGQLGFPVMAAMSAGPGADVQIQFFEHGIVTLRDGSAQAWIHPHSEELGGPERYAD